MQQEPSFKDFFLSILFLLLFGATFFAGVYCREHNYVMLNGQTISSSIASVLPAKASSSLHTASFNPNSIVKNEEILSLEYKSDDDVSKILRFPYRNIISVDNDHILFAYQGAFSKYQIKSGNFKLIKNKLTGFLKSEFIAGNNYIINTNAVIGIRNESSLYYAEFGDGYDTRISRNIYKELKDRCNLRISALK